MRISFVVPGKAIGKARPRFSKWGVYTPKKSMDYEKLVGMCFEQVKPYKWEPYTGAVNVTIYAYFVQAKSNKMEHCMIKPDIDNLVKSVLDGLNKRAYLDDKQVRGLVVQKFWGDTDKTVVIITSMEELDATING